MTTRPDQTRSPVSANRAEKAVHRTNTTRINEVHKRYTFLRGNRVEKKAMVKAVMAPQSVMPRLIDCLVKASVMPTLVRIGDR